jgi:hypothetical protein
VSIPQRLSVPSVGDVFVPANGPWDSDAALTTLAAHAIPGVESVDASAGTLTRALMMDGRFVLLRLTLTPAGVHVTLPEREPVPAGLEQVVRGWFDLDADISTIDHDLATSEHLHDLVESRPGVRVTGFVDGFEAVAATVLGQQVSLAAGRTLLGRLATACGTRLDKGLFLFPTPGQVAVLPADVLRADIGLTGAAGPHPPRCRDALRGRVHLARQHHRGGPATVGAGARDRPVDPQLHRPARPRGPRCLPCGRRRPLARVADP